MEMLTFAQGEFIVKLARKIVDAQVKKEKIEKPKIEDWMLEKRGVFTTIETYPSYELRGCIGVPYPTYSLIDALFISARGACSDPRFEPLSIDELEKIVIEVSILSVPKEIKVKNAKEYLEKIERYKDGIIIKLGANSALFLPQVWEKIEDKEEFLAHLCIKAGLLPNSWKNPRAKLFKFYVQIFKEEKPYGNIREIKL
ncbi:MAG: AmmeMemoRadiSam system protein A [Candidatus Aenigmatarchaeota archaeon]